ncbi:MAG TPA: bifunctional UDP-N-acetylmuramoyl-tripeptide:D-alanyl-D-alanine ligase/alanine racemase [Chitinophagaceae bacterium]|nr:bifunctional UDP-N-acetylmuramoyl-tripeptide:D-alanyl-D-alanine ligase/alanine racemase [Chitinophagaceae bacterium]
MYPLSIIAPVLNGTLLQSGGDPLITELAYDSRRILTPASALFFALSSAHADGHRYLADAYEKGVRAFVVADLPRTELPGASVIRVPDVRAALQALARFHRSHFSFPVIGITGSNGKTIVKEWLFQLLQSDYSIVRSPRSFNSQIGVPLSVWQMGPLHTLALLEAGISQRGEMAALQSVIRPQIGVLTNIGAAHSAGFASDAEKLQEKLLLFSEAEVLIAPAGMVPEGAVSCPVFSWGSDPSATVQVEDIRRSGGWSYLTVRYAGRALEFSVPFTDEASLQNVLTCCAVLLYLRVPPAELADRFRALQPVQLRLQLVHGLNGCTVLNDAYSADLTSLQAALAFLEQQHTGQQRTVILSDFFESGRSGPDLYRQIAAALQAHKIGRVLAIGPESARWLPPALGASAEVTTYATTEAFLQAFRSSLFRDEIILVKGARRFGFERIVQLFETKVHQTGLEINLNAIAHNLKSYQRLLQPGVKVMAMVKAFAYGSGGAEIAGVLQYNKVDYLGVAYTDEGVELKKAGIRLPVMVMNADPSSFQSLVDYGLEPVLYSFDLLHRFEQFLNASGLPAYPVHLELETGMNRLGFPVAEVPALARHLERTHLLKVASVFSHLAASEEPGQDAFTAQQAALFGQASEILKAAVPYPFLRHLSNSAAILRHPALQWDMVRLGIGLYGVEPAGGTEPELQAAATLKSTIAQLKQLRTGESVSYNRRGVVHRDSVIATVRIGYADGYTRRLGNGAGKMLVRGRRVPVIGSVCMDMTMLDVTDVPGVSEGDEVIVFGPGLPVQEVAGWAGTIPYELMTSVSQRVKRIYFQE